MLKPQCQILVAGYIRRWCDECWYVPEIPTGVYEEIQSILWRVPGDKSANKSRMKNPPEDNVELPAHRASATYNPFVD
jgi:hypothetical protein